MTTECTCTVDNCLHNSDRCCCKSEIQVDGPSAKDKAGTCCSSFDLRRHGCCKNALEHPDKKLKIECSAVSCVYNENHLCSAKQVDIIGGLAHNASATECATFQAR